MVHDLKPLFLDGRTVFTKQREYDINPPTSNIVVFSESMRGSALAKTKCDPAERAALRRSQA